MEPRELSPALLQPQVTVVATLAELLAAAPGENETPLVSPRCHLERFATELRVTLSRTAGTCWHHSVASNDGDAATSLSQALAAYGSMARSSRKRVAMVAIVWYMAVRGLGDSWARLARKATKLRRACGDAATRMDTRMDTKGDTKAATARARRLQDEAARDGTAQENVVEQGQALSREEGAEVVAGHEARVAASEATTATMERQRLEVTLGLLERLVAACDEAAALPRQLQHLLRDIEAALEGTNDPSPEVPKDLVAKVAEAERLWEANTCLAEDHLLGAVGDIIEFCINGGRSGPSGVAERCQRAIEDIPRLLRLPECPQGVPKVSAASVDPQELLRRQVTVVATLGKLLATTARLDGDVMLAVSPGFLHLALESFTLQLSFTLDHAGLTWWHREDEPPISLGRVLAAYESTPGVTWDHVTTMASEWQRSVARLKDSWFRVAREATKLRDACRDAATGRSTAVAVRRAVGEAVGEHTGEAVVAPSPMATTVDRQRAEEALGLLERLVAACDKAAAFPRQLQHQLRDIKAALEGTNEASPNVPKDLVAKVAKAERLWKASARLAKDHLLGALGDIDPLFFSCDFDGLTGLTIAERCQKAIEDIPRLLQDSDVTPVTSSGQ